MEARMATIVVPTDAPVIAGPPQGRWTYADWAALPADGNRYEVIDGVLFMTAAPSTFHQWIVFSLLRYVGVPAVERGLAYPLPAPVGVLMPRCEPVQPDFVVVRRERAGLFRGGRIVGVPDLIVEVLSPSNADYDRKIKLAAYAAAELPEYAIVDPQARTLTLHRLEAPGRYAEGVVAGEAETVAFACLPTISLAVADLFAGAPEADAGA
jgi:Uma2 family endonuclease